MPHHTRQDLSESCDVPSSASNNNNSFIPFYMRDDLPTNRQSKARVNQRRRRKTVQDVLQQKANTSPVVPNNNIMNNNSSMVAAGPNNIMQPSTPNSSNLSNNNLNNLNNNNNGGFLSSLQQQNNHQPPLAPKPSPHHLINNNNNSNGIPTPLNILPKTLIQQQQTKPNPHHPHQQQHVPILPKQQQQPPSISPRPHPPNVTTTPTHPNQYPLPFPPSPLTYQHYYQQQQQFINQNNTTNNNNQNSHLITTPPPQGIFPAQTFTEITTKFGGSVQYRNRKSVGSASDQASSSSEQEKLSSSISSSSASDVIHHQHHQQHHIVNNNNIAINTINDNNFNKQQQQQHHGIISTSAASTNIESSVVIIGEGRRPTLANSNSGGRSGEEMVIDSTPTPKVFTPRTTSSMMIKKEDPVEGKKPLSISSFLSAQSGTASATSSSNNRAPTSPRSNYINGVKTVSTAAVHKLKRLQQQIRSSDKDLHAINSSAQVLNYLKMVQQQQQAYIQQRMMLQSSSIPSLNISVNHIKNQLYNPSSVTSSSSSSTANHPPNNNSQEYLPSFIPSYQLDPTVDMMISNWENQIRQRQRQQKMQKYRVPNLRIPPQDYASNFMIDSSSSGGSSKGSHSDRSEAWMSARFASSTISSGRGTLSSGLGISPLNSPSSSCGTVSDCGMHYTADPNDLISPRIQQHHVRQSHMLITQEQLSPEDGDNDDEDDEGDTLMIDDSSPTTAPNKVLPPISTLNLPPLNLLSISPSTTDPHQDQSKSCPNSASRENGDHGIQTLLGSGSHKSVQPNPISLNNTVSNGTTYRPEGFITHRSHQQHYINNHHSNSSHSVGKQIHHQVHSTQRRVDSQHVESLISSTNVCPSPKRSNHQYHPYPLTSPRSKKKKVSTQDQPTEIESISFNFPPPPTSDPSQSSSSNAAEQAANQEEIQQRMSMQLFQAIFRHTPLPMFILNSRGKFMSVNHAFVNMLGYNQEDLFSNKFASEFVSNEHELMQQIHKCSHEGGLNNGVANQQHYSLSFRDSEGLEIQAENTIYVLRDVMYAGEFFVFTVTNYQASTSRE